MKYCAIAFLAAFLLLGPASSLAANQNTVRWPRYNTMPVKIHVVTDNAFDTQYTTVMKNGINSWDTGAAAPDIQIDYKPKIASCTATLAQNTVCVTTYFDANDPFGATFAPTYLCTNCGVDGKTLLKSGVIRVNTFWYNFGNPWPQHAYCHEFGHGLGLDEEDPPPAPACMSNDFTTPNTSNTASVDETSTVHTIYFGKIDQHR